jgi:hypothetical protein
MWHKLYCHNFKNYLKHLWLTSFTWLCHANKVISYSYGSTLSSFYFVNSTKSLAVLLQVMLACSSYLLFVCNFLLSLKSLYVKMILQGKIWIVHTLIDVLSLVDRLNLSRLNLSLFFRFTSNESILVAILYIQKCAFHHYYITLQRSTQLECPHAFVGSQLTNSPPSLDLATVWFWDCSPYGPQLIECLMTIIQYNRMVNTRTA